MNTDINALTCFTLSTTAQVAHLVLNKPEALNTMHPTFWRELDTVLAHLHQTGTARALVISSTGKHFSAGMALETFGGAITMDDQSPEGRAFNQARHIGNLERNHERRRDRSGNHLAPCWQLAQQRRHKKLMQLIGMARSCMQPATGHTRCG